MAKFTQTQLDRIKREAKIADVAQAQGMILSPRNKQLVTCCPWHDDKQPSLFIHPEKNLFNCFGCDAGGDVIEWMMKSEKIDFTQAVDRLLHVFPELREVSDSATDETNNNGKSKSNECPLDAELPDQQLLHQVLDF